MKKDYITATILIVIVILMSIAAKSSKALTKSVADIAISRLTDPYVMMKGQVPILTMADTSALTSDMQEENEETDESVKLELDNTYTSKTIPKGNTPRVLIYHTHINEAYNKTDNYTYKEIGDFRTDDKDKNVARIGKELSSILTNEYNISVTHDTTDFEPPRLGTAYSRSLKMLEERTRSDGEYDIYIDIHRDAYDYNDSDTITVNGQRIAKIMVVVGTGEGNNGTPILPRPDYKANYAFASRITDNLNSQVKGIAKDVRVNKSRYNQHISKRAILIEMGYTGNNINEVLASVPYLAQAINDTIVKGN